jgi:23S rRNA pseudouridine955/2504/2580 synthase
MKEMIVTGNQEGMSLHKFLGNVLPNAGGSFLYKMLRKKNITFKYKKSD